MTEEKIDPPADRTRVGAGSPSGPSFLPVIVAAGITIALVGVVHNLVIAAIGLVIAVGAIIRWVRETRAEIADLPLEH